MNRLHFDFQDLSTKRMVVGSVSMVIIFDISLTPKFYQGHEMMQMQNQLSLGIGNDFLI